jgi:hypothetical protein
MKTLLFSLILTLSLSAVAQEVEVPVQINLKDGTSFNAKHFGQLKCGKDMYVESYILIRGKYLGTMTEIKTYDDIQKIIFLDYKAEPNPSSGNEKGTVVITKKNGVSVDLKETEINMSCYSHGALYNQIVVQVENPLDGKVNEKTIATKDIESVVFR